MRNTISDNTKKDLKTVLDMAMFDITESLHTYCKKLHILRVKNKDNQHIVNIIANLHSRGITVGKVWQDITGDDLYTRRYNSFKRWLGTYFPAAFTLTK